MREHGDRLSTADAAFLAMESPTHHAHVGALMLFSAPQDGTFSFDRFARLVRARLHLAPHHRRKLGFAPLNLANPIWVDDERFDLAFHLRHAALPAPGTVEQLTEYAARVWARPLDRDRPLWELYVIEGLEDGGFAVLSKSHHAMVDGLRGVDLATVLLDPASGRAVAPGEEDGPEPWEAQAAPSGYSMAFSGVRSVLTSPADAVGSAKRLFEAPTRAARRAIDVGRGIVSVAGTTMTSPAPRSELNGAVGQSRRFAIHRVALADAKAIKAAYRTTVNDVVLTLVADTTGRMLRERGVRTDGMWLRAMVPVSVATGDGEDAFGQRVVSSFVSLPVGEMDPVERLNVISEAMAGQSSERQAVGAGFLTGLADYAPITIHAMASRLATRSRLFNFLVTNVPGPQAPMYLLGARLEGAFPFTALGGNTAYGVGVISTDGWLNVGFTGDHLGLPELASAPRHLEAALAELLRCAVAVGPATMWPGEQEPPEPGIPEPGIPDPATPDDPVLEVQ